MIKIKPAKRKKIVVFLLVIPVQYTHIGIVHAHTQHTPESQSYESECVTRKRLFIISCYLFNQILNTCVHSIGFFSFGFAFSDFISMSQWFIFSFSFFAALTRRLVPCMC